MKTIILHRADFSGKTVMGFEDLVEYLVSGLARECIEKIDSIEFGTVDGSVRLDDIPAEHQQIFSTYHRNASQQG